MRRQADGWRAAASYGARVGCRVSPGLDRSDRGEAGIDAIFCKTLRVLPEAKSAETIRNLLHGGHRLSRVWPKGTLDKIDTISRPFLDGTAYAWSLDFNPTRGYRYTTAVDSIVDRERRRRDLLTYEGAVAHWKCPNLA